MYCCWRSSYQDGRVGVPSTGLTLPHVCPCPKTGPEFPRTFLVVFICLQWVQLRWEVIVHLVDIGGTDDLSSVHKLYGILIWNYNDKIKQKREICISLKWFMYMYLLYNHIKGDGPLLGRKHTYYFGN
jgi:hypothetical protein